MSAHAYTEDQLVEQPAIGLFAELGWAIAFANLHTGAIPVGEGVIVDELGLLGRKASGEVVLVFLALVQDFKRFVARKFHEWATLLFKIQNDFRTRDLLAPRLASGRVGLNFSAAPVSSKP